MISLTVFKTSVHSLHIYTLTVLDRVMLIIYIYPLPVLHIINLTCLTPIRSISFHSLFKKQLKKHLHLI